MSKAEYKVGTSIPTWGGGQAQSITFVVTDDCNLRCKYCYITHKTSTSKMDFEMAKRFVDFMLEGDINRKEALILEFIGGEPFLEIDLIDKISDYFKLRAFELDHPWYWNYRFSISTNGINYSDALVQAYINKNLDKISCGMTLDGTKEKHDMQRVYPDGSGSYDAVFKNIDLYKTQFNNTKVTFASDDLPLLKESIISLWDNGITEVFANVVFEDVWKDGDDLILENQLKSLADYVLDNMLYNKYICSFFDDSIGSYYTANMLNQTSCGAGKMLAFGSNGKIYPCLRYKGYSLNKKDEWVIGDVDNGIDMEKVRPFMAATYKLQSDEECLSCEVATGCRFCQGFNYDEAETPTNFYRAKYICKMHKARVRANDYYFAKLYNIYGIERKRKQVERNSLYFLLSDDFVDYCPNINTSKEYIKMSDDNIKQGLEYGHKNFFNPIFIHSRSRFTYKNMPYYHAHKILHIVPARFHAEAAAHLKNYILVFDENSLDTPVTSLSNCMLNIRQENINFLYNYIESVLVKCNRVNVNIMGLDKYFNVDVYKEQLLLIKDWLVRHHKVTGEIKEINLITDLCFINVHNNCKAGDKAFTLAPDGKLYVCSAFYIDKDGSAVGDTVNGITNLGDAHLYKTQNHALCIVCDAYQCINCVHLNKRATQEISVSPSYQCIKGFVEREVSRQYQQEMGESTEAHVISETKYKEPMGILTEINDTFVGCYEYTDV